MNDFRFTIERNVLNGHLNERTTPQRGREAYRVRVIKGKGKKDRYTVLCKKVLIELRQYFIQYKPQVYLFNGRKKGQKMSEGAIRHALEGARKKSRTERFSISNRNECPKWTFK